MNDSRDNTSSQGAQLAQKRVKPKVIKNSYYGLKQDLKPISLNMKRGSQGEISNDLKSLVVSPDIVQGTDVNLDGETAVDAM